MRLITLLVGIFGLVFVGLAAFYIMRLGALPLKYILLIFGIDAAIAVVPIILVVTGRNVKKCLCIILSVLMIVLNLLVISYGDLTYKFLHEQYKTGAVGNIEYSVVTRASAYAGFEQGKTYSAGIQALDICKAEAIYEMENIVPSVFSEYDSVSELLGAAIAGDIDVAVVQTVSLDAYAEYFPESFAELTAMTTFNASVPLTENTATDLEIDITQPFAIYVSGADDYGEINQTARSDVNMLILIDPEHYRMLLVNTPRDYYVQLHGTSGLPDKLTHAGTYGIEMSEATLEDLYGIEIDYHVHINYETLVTLIDSIGGIVVDNPVAFNLWGAQFNKGEIYMDGEHALYFCRARKMLAGGDNDRGQNQQRVIEALVKRFSASTLAVHYTEILEGLSGRFRSNIPPSVIGQLFQRQISLGGDWSVDKLAATGTPASQPTYTMGSDNMLDVTIPDIASLNYVSEKMNLFMQGIDPEIEKDLDALQAAADMQAAPETEQTDQVE